MSVTVKSRYTSIACGRSPHCLDWNTNGLICYGASHVIVLYDMRINGNDPIRTLHHHKGKVNSVKWIQRLPQHPSEFISCSGDKTAAVWSYINGEWTARVVLEGHKDAVTCADGLYVDDRLLVFTSSVDSSIRIWQRNQSLVKCIQTIALGSGLCLTLRCTFLPRTKTPILIAALDDDKMYIFAQTDKNEEAEFHKVISLVGHEDWVRGLDVMTQDNDSLLIASSSQDTYIRLWSVSRHAEDESESGIRVQKRLFVLEQVAWSCKLEAVLAGHEGWVYGVQWCPPIVHPDGTMTCVQKLLSSSLDKTLIIWQPEGEESAWVESVRVGEVGGSGLGYYGSRFGPGGVSFVGHGYNGSFHLWNYSEDSRQWEASVVIGGHFGEVSDVRWEPHYGRYIMSVSADQTTRVHSVWTHDDVTEWHEIARPQIHGFDLSSVALVSSTIFVSGAEEKVIRAFQAPHNFVQNFKNITKMELAEEGNCNGPEGASIPSLGLSNKAVFSGDQTGDAEKEYDVYFVPTNLTEPPTEEMLMQNTLWPELHKLYGHGYEVFTLDASPDGSLVASACKATLPQHASILLWDTREWQQVQKLPSHQLTVTQLAFSPNSQRLLSVSRDRRWSLFHRRQGLEFTLAATTDKTNGVHTRIIWCCSWTYDSAQFATGSREGKICLWGDTGNTKESSLGVYGLHNEPLDISGQSVTALAFAPVDIEERRLLSVGFEKGIIQIYSVDSVEWILLRELDNNMAHHLTVSRLSFRPTSGEAGVTRDPTSLTLQLASAGTDHLVRIYNIYLY